MNKMGIDFGGTKIVGILLDDNFNILERKRIPTPSDYDSILNIIENLIFDLKNKSNDLTSIGIGIPGIFSCNTGIINHSNTSCLIGKSFQKDLEDLIEQKISIDNDSNCYQYKAHKVNCPKDKSQISEYPVEDDE